MKILPLILVSFFGVFCSDAFALEDGFYVVTGQPTPLPVTTLDGQKIYLGNKLPDALKGGSLISRTNDNSHYDLQVWRNAPSEQDRVAFVLNDQCLLFNSQGGDATHCNLGGDISDRKFLNLAAAFLKITLQDRKHPGHQFTARFVVNPEGYKLSDPVMVTLEITNCGPQSFFIEQPSIPGALDVFSFTAFGFGPQWDPKNNAVANKPYSEGPIDMITSKFEIKPQQTKSIPVVLSDYLVLNKTGSYFVRGTYAFKVMSPDQAYKVIWDDFATAEFEVKIK